MRYRYNMMLLGVCLPMCLVLRALQLIFTIDEKTGFIKQQYSSISVVITVVIFAGIAAVGLICFASNGVTMKKKDKNLMLAATSFLVGIVFICDTAVQIFSMNISAWYDLISMLLGLISAAVFIAFGVKKIYSYKFFDSLLTIPVFYYIVRLISVFVSTSELALVTENIFLLFTNGALLFFMFEFAKVENDIDEKPKTRKIFSSGIIASMLCMTQSVPKIAAYGGSMSPRDIVSSLLTFAVGLFVLSYIMSGFGDKSSDENIHTAKHLSE